MGRAQLSWGFIGCGSVTEKKSGPAYQNTPGFNVKAAFRRNLEKAADYANRHGIEKVCQTAQALISDPEIDAVYIATPPDSHLTYALQVAAAGKICCIEKPLAPSLEEAQQIYRTFADNQIPLFVAYYRRSLPRFRQIKQWIEQGKIGSPRHIHWQLTREPNALDKSREYNWRTDKTIALGGYFDDLASHGLNLFSFFFGELQQASGIAKNQLGLYSSFDSVTGNWCYQNGVTGSGVWNFASDKHRDKVEIIGSEGSIVFSIFDEQPLNLICGDQVREVAIENPENIQKYHVENIYHHLFSGQEHPSMGKSAVDTAWLMQKILENKINS